MDSPILETRNLTKNYGATVALDGLNLTLEAGEIFGFLGPNGAGKTTTIRLFLDLIRPTRGEVRLFGESPSSPGARGRVGYLPDLVGLDDRLTGRETLAFFGALSPRSARAPAPTSVESLCERLGLAARDLDRVVRDDSRGTKQKVAIAAAFQGNPDLLILDEPTTGLDPLVRETVFDLMREAARAGRTIFHSSHVLSEVDRTCSRVGILRDGKLVALETVETLRRAAVRKMVVRFAGPVPSELPRIPGVEIVERDAGRLVLHVTGELRPLLGFLSEHPVTDVVFPERDLDEVFAHYYRGPDAGR